MTAIKELPVQDQLFLVALNSVSQRIRTLSADDRRDLLEVAEAFLATDDDDERDYAAKTIVEILSPVQRGVHKLELPEDDGTLANWTSRLSKRIRDSRIEAGLTQTQLAEKCGLTQSHICRLETGQHSPNALTIEKIAKALGVTVGRIDPKAPDES